jgi:Rod binding domain-containing protein
MNFAIATASTTSALPAKDLTSLEHRKLSVAAQQFEGMLLQELLKPMREHGFCQNDEEQTGDQGNSGGDTLSSFGTEVMATAIAKAGGLGIAQRVVAQVEGEKVSCEKGTAKDRQTLAIPGKSNHVTKVLARAADELMKTEVSA